VLDESRLSTESRMSSSSVRGKFSFRALRFQLTFSEYVALEKLEGMFALDPLFATLLVHGDSTQPSIVAVAVLDPVQASAFIKKVNGKSVPPTDMAGLEEQVRDPRIKKEILKGLTIVAKKNRLNG
jgi:long-chain acyl-CoA synthetase